MASVADIFKSRQRKKNVTEGKTDETASITAERADLVHVYKCASCTYTLESPAAKCFLENCTDTTLKFSSKLMSGIMELYNCTNVRVHVSPQDQLPTVVIDNCSKIDLFFGDPKLLKDIYTTASSDIVIHLDPPYKKEEPLKWARDVEKEEQCVSHYQLGKLVTEKVVRMGGGFPTTAAEQEKAEQRARIMEQHTTKMVQEMFKAKKPAAPSVPKATPKPQPKEEPPAKEPAAAEPRPPVERPLANLNTEELLSTKDKLSHTETVERHTPVVGTGKPGGGGFNPAIDDGEDKKEYFDSPESLDRKLDEVAGWVKASKHVIMFTGAGISTSAGIPDFRSGMDTVLETGPGVWEARAHADQPVNRKNLVKLIKALPSVTHMGIVALHNAGLVRFTVSQNIDGLHRRSGLDPHEFSELHGNTNLEHCLKCGREYLRDFETREAIGVYNHATSRQCDDPNCRGTLLDSIVNFGENLPKGEVDKAFINADKADLCIVLGSSLRVSPACDIPRIVGQNGKLVICNLQKTPLHNMAHSNIHAKCDDFTTGLLKRLGLEPSPFQLTRRVHVQSKKDKATGGSTLTVTGVDLKDNTPYSFILGVSVQMSGQEPVRAAEEPLVLSLPASDVAVMPVELFFHGHYQEPPHVIQHMLGTSFYYLLTYNLQDNKWFHKALPHQ